MENLEAKEPKLITDPSPYDGTQYCPKGNVLVYIFQTFPATSILIIK